MLRRSGFGHGCVMQDIAGIPSGERSTCAGAVPDVAAVPVPVEAGVSRR
jgi:hypothetical protein